MRNFRVLAALAAAALLGWDAPASAQSQNAVAYQINPQHSGAIVFPTAFVPPFRFKWQIDLGGAVGYPLIVGQTVYVVAANATGSSATLFALDLANGQVIWRKLLGSSTTNFTIAYDGGRLFTLRNDGLLQAFAARTGLPLWNVNLGSFQTTFGNAPVGSNGLLFVTASVFGAGTVWQLSEATGQVGWTQGLFGAISEPAVGAGSLFVDGSCNVYALVPASGSVVWQQLVNTTCVGNAPPTAYAYGRVYATGAGAILNASTGAVLGPLDPATAAIGHRFSYAARGSQIVATDLTTGNQAWSFTTALDSSMNRPAFLASPVLVNGVVLDAATDSLTFNARPHIYVLDAASGHLLQLMRPRQHSGFPFAPPPTGLAAGQGVALAPVMSELVAFGP